MEKEKAAELKWNEMTDAEKMAQIKVIELLDRSIEEKMHLLQLIHKFEKSKEVKTHLLQLIHKFEKSKEVKISDGDKSSEDERRSKEDKKHLHQLFDAFKLFGVEENKTQLAKKKEFLSFLNKDSKNKTNSTP